MAEKPLRDYQTRVVDELKSAILDGHKRILISLPTGAGKTRVALEVAKRAAGRGNKTAALCERVILCHQWQKAAAELGLHCGVIQEKNNTIGHDITSYSQQTIEARMGSRKSRLPAEKIIFVDECHVQRSMITEWLRGLGDDQIVVGLTATPMVAGLGDTYHHLICGPTTDELTAAGWLIPEKVFEAQARLDVDSMNVNLVNGEYAGKDIDREVAAVRGDIPAEWLRMCRDTLELDEIPRTVVFSATIASGKMLTAAFNDLDCGMEGPIAQQITCDDPKEYREKAMAAFEDGSRPVIVNVAIVGRGWDCPSASVLIDASPFRSSIHAYIQMIGRVLRPAAGRAVDGEFGYVFDHCGNYQRFIDQWIRFRRDGVTELLPDKEPGEDRGGARWVQTWTCHECGVLNPLASGKCGEDPHVEGCGEERIEHCRRGVGWRCGTCRRVNDPLAEKCAGRSCEGRAPASGGDDGEDEFRCWKCPACSQMNASAETACAGCGEPKPRSWEELDGELVEVSKREPVGCHPEVDGAVKRDYAWAHICELALRHYLKRRKTVNEKVRRSAEKLAQARYMAMFNVWPSFRFHDVREPDVDPRVQQWWDKKQAEYKASAPWRGGRYAPAAQANLTGTERRRK